ncbi:MAG: hypothetical protein IKW89_00050 [Bacteroidales bacterium]|nr:hypothetical protein [Bacteroidales bacterium]
MMFLRFYKYATEYPWFMRLGMIISYVLAWFAFVLCMLMLLVTPSMPGYKAVLTVVLFGGYFYTLIRMRQSMKVEPEVIAQMKVDAGVTSLLNKSIKKLL